MPITKNQPVPPLREVLLIDDEQSVLLALKLLLQALGYTVKDFHGGEGALQFLKGEGSCDFCICDLKMPRLNGMVVLEQALKIRPTLPFVLMSAHATTEEVDKARQLGAAGFLAKPFTPEQLTGMVEEIGRKVGVG